MQTQTQSGFAVSSETSIPPANPHRSKLVVAWLACLLGVFGAQWWYLGRQRAWMVTAFSCAMIVLAQLYPDWWENPPFLMLLIPITAGFTEALIFALKPDDQFDLKYNPASGRTTKTGWGPVILAIFTTLLSGIVVTGGISIAVIYVYTSMGWLDGLVL